MLKKDNIHYTQIFLICIISAGLYACQKNNLESFSDSRENRMVKKIILSCIYILLFTGCSMVDNDQVCASIGYPGIVLEATEIKTGEPAKNYFVTARQGAYIDSIFIADGKNMSANLIIGSTGNFDVTVGGDDYITWNKKNVTVSSDGCHPVTVFKEVALEGIE